MKNKAHLADCGTVWTEKLRKGLKEMFKERYGNVR